MYGRFIEVISKLKTFIKLFLIYMNKAVYAYNQYDLKYRCLLVYGVIVKFLWSFILKQSKMRIWHLINIIFIIESISDNRAVVIFQFIFEMPPITKWVHFLVG